MESIRGNITNNKIYTVRNLYIPNHRTVTTL